MENSITIVTICFNNLAELIETCGSVDKQNHLPDQHLIIDGSSSEHIIGWLKSSKQPAYREWIHERDQGISDAFNKGIKRSTGEIIHLLNSGDRYFDENAIAEVMKNFETQMSLMWVHSLYVQNRGGLDVITGSPFQKELLWKGMRTVAHPTMFVKKNCIKSTVSTAWI